MTCITEHQVRQMLGRSKTLYKKMRWSCKLNQTRNIWWSFESPILIDDQLVEGLVCRCQWRAPTGFSGMNAALMLLWEQKRVFAWCIDSTKRHRNHKSGADREYYGQLICGNHEHVWCEARDSDDNQQDSYAKPIEGTYDLFCDAWQAFARQANIQNVTCVPPDEARQAGQSDFLDHNL